MSFVSRESFIPKGSVKVADKLSDAVAYIGAQDNGRLYGTVFYGKQSRPVANYAFRSEAEREATIRKYFEGRRTHEAYVVEQRAARKAPSEISGNGYISTPQAAVMVRAALKKAFPGVKFSVRSDSYSMGSHMVIGWTDGPAKKAVEALVGPYSGKSFDAMIDMSYSTDSWLLPDGTVVYGGTSGTAGSAGSVSEDKVECPHPEAKLVHFLGSRPSLNRTISPEFEAACEAKWSAMSGQEQCDLLNGSMPRWEEVTAGRRLAEITAA